MKRTLVLSKLLVLLSSGTVFGENTFSVNYSQSVSFGTLVSNDYQEISFDFNGLQPPEGTLTINDFSSTETNALSASFVQTIGTASVTLEGTASNQIIQLPGLSSSSSPISGTVTISGGTLQGNASSAGSLNLSNSGAVYDLNGSDQTITSLAGVSGTTVNLGANTLTINNASGSFLGTVAGTGNVAVKQGTLTLTNENNPFKGTVQLVNENSALTFNQPDINLQTFQGNITGAGALNLEGNGTVNLTGTNTFTGGTTIQGPSTLQGTTETLPTQSGITLYSANPKTLSTVNFNQSQPGTYAQAITGFGGVVIEQGSITFTGPNTYTGGTKIENGDSYLIASIGNDKTPGTLSSTGDIEFAYGGGSMIFNQSPGGQPLDGEYAGVISGDGDVFIGLQGVQKVQEAQEVKGGSLTFTGANIYNGTTVIYPSNTLIASAGNSTTPATLPDSNNTIQNQGTLVFTQSASTDPYSFSAPISFSGQVIIAPSKAGGAFTLSLTGDNSYTGETTVEAKGAVLQGAFPNSTVVLAADGSTYSLNGKDQTLGGLAGDNTSALVMLDGRTLTVGNNNLNTTFSGTIKDGSPDVRGNLKKVGSGTLTLATPPQYKGKTTIEEGTLIGQIPTTSATHLIINGGTFQMAASQNFPTISGSGGTLNLEGFNLGITGNSSLGLAANIIGTGSVNIGPSGPASFTFTGNNTYTGGTTVSTGSTLTGTTNSLIGTINNTNLVVFSQNFSAPFTGVINGSGTVETFGMVTFPPGSINCTGGLINESDIIVSASSIKNNIVNNGSVTFNQTTAGTYAGKISGGGSLIKDGGG
ncbi:MAG: autotransporter-associated beta strand repeat-containing protein, partial [Alphaproteobacteria bacterium]|nr:autotransporter-associated beta strand repeat-containing protein [Alphaproteobacteria bacterium]